MVAFSAAVIVMGLAVLAEWIHARRTARVAFLAFGPRGRPMPWVRLAAPLRIVSFGLLTWSLMTLTLLEPRVHNENDVPPGERRHLVLVIDVSPSMFLEDAGPDLNLTRRQRASDLVESLFSRIPLRRYRVSVIAVYNGARPMVVDSSDFEVVRYIIEKLPVYQAFESGRTDLFAGLQEASRIARPWNPKSTSVVLLTDGDTVPATGIPRMPASVSTVMVVGVGDFRSGQFIDGHQSRQNVMVLRQIAHRLDGVYHNGNQKHLPSQMVRLMQESHRTETVQPGLREWALMAALFGSLTAAGLPVLLCLFGTSWKPGVPPDRVDVRSGELVSVI